MRYKLSIILPVYNSEDTIARTINSVFKQNFKDFQLIIINDGSTDSTNNICEEFTKRYNNILYINVVNGGVSKARNIGISYSNSDYIMFIDSDDTYKPGMLQIMINEISQGFDIVCCGYVRIARNGKRIIKNLNRDIFTKANMNTFIEDCQKNNMFNQLWNKIFKSSIIINNNIKFDENVSLGEDYRFILSYIDYCKKLETIDDILYCYYVSSSGLNKKYRKDRHLINFENLEKLESVYSKYNYKKDYIYYRYFTTVLSSINNIYKSKDKKAIKEDIEFLKNSKILSKLAKYNNIKSNLLAFLIKLNNYYILKLLQLILSIVELVNNKKLGY